MWTKSLNRAIEWRVTAFGLTMILSFAFGHEFHEAVLFSIALHSLLFVANVVWLKYRVV